MRAALLSLACLAVAGCDNGAMIRSDARDAVRREVLDPSRAVFSNVEVSAGGAVCGLVNAPNRFGGMTGPQRFVVIPARDRLVREVILEERHSPAFLDEIDALAGCRRK